MQLDCITCGQPRPPGPPVQLSKIEQKPPKQPTDRENQAASGQATQASTNATPTPSSSSMESGESTPALRSPSAATPTALNGKSQKVEHQTPVNYSEQESANVSTDNHHIADHSHKCHSASESEHLTDDLHIEKVFPITMQTNEETDYVPVFTDTMIKEAQETDDYCKNIIKNLPNDKNHFLAPNGLLYQYDEAHACRLVIPKSLLSMIIDAHHTPPIMGHRSYRKTLELIRENYTAPKLNSHVENFVKASGICTTRNSRNPHYKNLLQKLPDLTSPLQLVYFDCVGPVINSNGFRYWMIIQDGFSKFLTLVPLKTLQAEEIALAFVTRFIAIFGAPTAILCDRAPSFLGSVVTQICKFLKIKRLCSIPYGPRINISERGNRSTYAILSKIIDQIDDWSTYFPIVAAAYNSHFHSSHKMSPLEVHTGIKPKPSHYEIEKPLPLSYAIDRNFGTEFKCRMQQIYQFVAQNLKEAQEKWTEQFNKKATKIPQYYTNQMVFVKDLAITTGSQRKLGHPYVGPYQVLGLLNVTAKLKHAVTGKIILAHLDRLKPCYDRAGNYVFAPPPQPSSPSILRKQNSIRSPADINKRVRFADEINSDNENSEVSEDIPPPRPRRSPRLLRHSTAPGTDDVSEYAPMDRLREENPTGPLSEEEFRDTLEEQYLQEQDWTKRYPLIESTSDESDTEHLCPRQRFPKRGSSDHFYGASYGDQIKNRLYWEFTSRTSSAKERLPGSPTLEDTPTSARYEEIQARGLGPSVLRSSSPTAQDSEGNISEENPPTGNDSKQPAAQKSTPDADLANLLEDSNKSQRPTAEDLQTPRNNQQIPERQNQVKTSNSRATPPHEALTPDICPPDQRTNIQDPSSPHNEQQAESTQDSRSPLRPNEASSSTTPKPILAQVKDLNYYTYNGHKIRKGVEMSHEQRMWLNSKTPKQSVIWTKIPTYEDEWRIIAAGEQTAETANPRRKITVAEDTVTIPKTPHKPTFNIPKQPTFSNPSTPTPTRHTYDLRS